MVITAQQLVKRQYQKLLRYAFGGSVLIVFLLFLFTPAYAPNPYKLKEEVFEIIDIPDEIEIPPPPQEIEMPKVRVEIEISDEASEEDTIEDTSFDSFEDMPPPVIDGGGGPQKFYAFDEPPILTFRAPVRYPEIAREAEMEGIVQILVYVDERGNVFDAQVLSSTVPKILVNEALRAARRCRFKPGKQRNVPVKTTIMIPFDFRIRG
ncbi:MAG: energy transducer TonB [Candidatus Krumholzibacteria bacterium]|jgi:protein TonB|nr:energy transducer TonB [Candidatus Krumholzibacteria bacterium]MDP6669613.1 energy transducer TonB [Candidatus Krumholzibacteria bacterium]MDP7021173.1 energy transducer TonB [Candidatus Krumholzibacteria bacterium]